MTVNYTSLLKLAQPVNGSEDGAWGTVVNESLTSPVEIAIAGAATIDVTSGNVTLTNGDGSASNQSRYAILLVTGTPGVTRNVIAPGTSKIYLVKNSSDGSVVIKGASTTGVTIPAGEEVFVFWNGSDYEIASIAGPSVATDNAVARFDGTTGKILQNSAVTIADTTGDITGGKYNGLTISTTTGTLTVANGKTLTASNTITLAGTDGTTMTFPGTSASVARTDAAQTFTGVQTFSSSPIISALTADKLVFTDSSKALVSSGSVGTDQGGTGQTTYTAGDMVYYATGTAMTKLGIGTTDYVLTSSGSAPQWSAPASVVIGTATNIQGGAAGSVPYQSGASTTTFLGIGSAAQVLQVNSSGTAPEWVSSTGTGSVVRATSPTLVTPALGTPSTINLANATNLPLGSIAGLGTGVATALAINVGSGGAFVPTTGSGASGTWSISVTGSAASATTSTNLAGGAANQIAYQTGSDTTAFITAPTTSNTFLKWNGTSLGWDTVSGGGGGTTTNPVTFNNTGGGASSGATFDGSSAVTISYNTIGAPSTTGGGATGNWNINITGSAASATTATSATSATTATTATNIAGGTATQIPYQSGVGATTFVTAPTTSGSFLKWNGTTYVWDVPLGGGDVVGPASATDNAIARFDGTSGKIIQNSAVTIADSTGDISGVGQLNATTVDATNVEVTNIKAKDGTAAATIADSTGVVTVTAAPVMTALTASQAVFTTAGKALTSNAITGTGNVVMSASPTLTGTIAGASLQLSSLTSGRVTYAGASGLLQDSANLLYSGTDLTVYGITVGRGAGAVSTNTAVGASALAAGPSGRAVAIGYQALTATTADSNTAVGYQAGYTNTTGYYLVAMGREALYSNTSGISNVGIGDYALQANTTASNNTAVGYQALYASNRTADANGYNTAIGYGSGSAITTGQKNTILGRYSGNQGGLDIRTASNYVVLSDGDGNPLVSTADNQTVALEGAVPNSGTGITFPATQSASSNANTLDDYEEGTWTATLTDGTNTVTSDGATYRKIGSLVFVSFQFYNKNISAWNAANLSVTGLPFTVATNHDSFITVGTPNGFTVSGPLTMSFGNGSTSSSLYYRGGSSNWAAVQKGDITNNANFSLYLSACYTAS
jgi:hypothetical protein